MDKVVLRQAFKTALASSIAAACYLYFSLPNGFWAVIVAAMVMQSDMETGSFRRTLAKGLYRITGTISGALIGLICLYVVRDVMILAVPIGFIVVFLCIYFLEPLTGMKMTAATALIVMLVSAHYHEPWDLAVYRSLSIILGCVIAVVVTVCVMPYRSEYFFKNSLVEHIVEQKQIFRNLIGLYKQQRSISTVGVARIARLRIDMERSRSILLEISKHAAGDRKLKMMQQLFQHVQSTSMYLRRMSESENRMHDDMYFTGVTKILDDLDCTYVVLFDRIINALQGNIDKQVGHINMSSRSELILMINLHRKNRLSESDDISSLDDSYYLLSFYHAVVHIGDVLMDMCDSIDYLNNPSTKTLSQHEYVQES